MEDDEDFDFRDQSGMTFGADDAQVIVDFAVGASGVGPVVGFGSDDFFPSAPDPDAVHDTPGSAESTREAHRSCVNQSARRP